MEEINQKAWATTKKYADHEGISHYFDSNGPCCSVCGRLYRAVLETMQTSYASGYQYAMGKDDPEMDATDFAHPAWWRGNERAFLTAVHEVNDILDGTASNVGINIEPWQSLRQRLYDIRTLLGIAERVMNDATVGVVYPVSTATWNKVRADYEQRVQGIRAAKKTNVLD
jgi:hypothetical protein